MATLARRGRRQQGGDTQYAASLLTHKQQLPCTDLGRKVEKMLPLRRGEQSGSPSATPLPITHRYNAHTAAEDKLPRCTEFE